MNFEVEYNPKNNKENISKKYGKTVKRKKKKSSNKKAPKEKGDTPEPQANIKTEEL